MMKRKIVIHNHLPKRARDANQAYKVKVRRLTSGADFNVRIFAASQEIAEQRAKERARQMEHIPLDKYKEYERAGHAVFRIVSSELDPDQSRPTYDRNAFEHALSKEKEEANRDKMYRDAGIVRVLANDADTGKLVKTIRGRNGESKVYALSDGNFKVVFSDGEEGKYPSLSSAVQQARA